MIFESTCFNRLFLYNKFNIRNIYLWHMNNTYKLFTVPDTSEDI